MGPDWLEVGGWGHTCRLFDWSIVELTDWESAQTSTQTDQQGLGEGYIARASHPAAPGSMPSVPKKFSEEKLSMLLRLINGAG